MLKNKVAIITGGNSGIGEATALLFAKEGAKVVITARRKEQLENVAQRIRGLGGEVLVVTSDISKKEDCKNVIDETINITNVAAKVMLENKSGAIINVASVAGVYGSGGAVYCASKGAIIGLTKNIALRMAKEGIRCNVVCPGSVKTPMSKSENLANMNMDMMNAMRAHADLKLPVCEPEDVANTIAFLASDKARAITGQVLVTDFGANL